jgi:hypothetical protein
MKFDIDLYISLMNSMSDGYKSELEEDEPASGGGASGGNTLKRGSNWNELYVTKRGHANMLGKTGEKWTTGLTRGVANQVW